MTEPRQFAYENPADLAWGAQLLRTARRRRLLRLAAEEAAADLGLDGTKVKNATDVPEGGAVDG